MGVYGDLLKLNETKYVAVPQKPKEHSTPPGEQVTPPAEATPTTPPRHRGRVVSRYHDAMIQIIRAAVKLFGKEAATHRFTVQEKKAIADIVYTYKQQDVRTSENEITRIGVNFILNDYQENGESSLLHRVLKALNSCNTFAKIESDR
jgi:hypothetical protein